MSELPPEHTRLNDGRILSTEELAPIVYDDLRRLASGYLRREIAGQTLQPTALVNEACIQLLGQDVQDWESKGHFLAVAATAMRRILINAARDKGRLKRGGDRNRVSLSEASGPEALEVDLLDLDAALERLAGVNERYVRIVELRYFSGLSIDETALALGSSRASVVREWAKARAWLEDALENQE